MEVLQDHSDTKLETFSISGLNQDVYAVNVTVGDNTPAATTIYGKIYESTQTGWDFIGESLEYEVSAQDVTNNAEIALVLLSPASLEAGKTYLAVVGCYTEFYTATAGNCEPQLSFVLYPSAGGSGSQYYTTSIPMVRMNFDPSIGIKETANANFSLAQNMPNPFNENTVVNYTLNQTSNVMIQITDVTGKVVSTMDQGTQGAGTYTVNLNASELSNGTYFYTLTDGHSSVTKAMVVKK